ncbi:MAG: response regulator [Planctomycetes bacterium]|nr:response regulator [Planctomycetota bacterium]
MQIASHDRLDSRHSSLRPTALIVEDDPDIRGAWSILLDHQGYDVASTARGDEGLRLALDREHDLILLDLGLPGMSGSKLLHELRMAKSDTPVVVVTANDDPRLATRALRSGASHFVQKPVEHGALLAILDEVRA